MTNENNKVMKANAPEKIYLQEPTKVRTEKKYDNDVEYIRTDAFIEKAFEFFENELCCYVKAQDFVIEHSRLENGFKAYMKGE